MANLHGLTFRTNVEIGSRSVSLQMIGLVERPRSASIAWMIWTVVRAPSLPELGFGPSDHQKRNPGWATDLDPPNVEMDVRQDPKQTVVQVLSSRERHP